MHIDTKNLFKKYVITDGDKLSSLTASSLLESHPSLKRGLGGGVVAGGKQVMIVVKYRLTDSGVMR